MIFGSLLLAAVAQSEVGATASTLKSEPEPSPDLSELVRPRNFTPLYRAIRDGYPEWANMVVQEGVTKVTVDVTVQGRVSRCSVTGSSGYLPSDELVCAAMKDHALFYPARDVGGNPMQGSYSTSFRFRSGIHGIRQLPQAEPRKLERWQKRVQHDIVQTVQEFSWRGSVDYVLGVTHKGKPSVCYLRKSTSHQALDFELCEALKKRARFEQIETNYPWNSSVGHYAGQLVIGAE